MFIKKVSFSNRLKFDEKSFNQIIRQLRLAGFHDIKIKIPEKIYPNFPKTIFTPDEFVALKYNFVAQILSAMNERESVKILFLNHANHTSSFNDNTFPSGHSVQTSFHLETNDPVRLSGMADFISSLLKENNKRGPFVAGLQKFLFAISTLYLYAGIFAFISVLSAPSAMNSILLMMALSMLFIFYVFFYITHPGGLYIGPFEHPIVSFIRRLSAGDFKNNLVLTFIIWILKAIVFSVVLGVVTNVVWLYLENPFKALLQR